MPSGIGPELVIFFVLLLLVGTIFVVSRRRPATPKPASRKPPPPPPRAAERPKPGLNERLAKSRTFLSQRLAEALGQGPAEQTWDDVETALIQADVGLATANEIVRRVRGKALEQRVTEVEEVRALLRQELIDMFDTGRDRALAFAPEPPTVWLVAGANGTGKTTTIGKLASDLSRRGRRVALAAADTFRAAADDQLDVWAERSLAELVKHQPGADPGAVAYDAFRHARAKAIDVLIVDTAGRLHTKTPLMDELGKVRRVIEKEGRVDESLLVIDATGGQNSLVQAREFAGAAGVSGIVLTKLDGSAKGGITIAIEQSLGIPIKLIGLGEGIEDLEPFEPKSYIDALLA